MRAWMTSTDFDYVGGHDNVQLSFWLWYDTEPTNDYFEYYYSYDNTNWYRLGGAYSGYSNGWVQIVHNVPSNVDYYYMEYKFRSNYQYSAYAGAYVDDIVLSGDIPPQKPNLTYDTPPGWDDALVLSHDSGTHDNNLLYTGSDTYIDFAIINIGDTTSPSTTIAFYIDDVFNAFYGTWSLEPLNFDSTINDQGYLLSEGWHTLKFIIDKDNDVDELDETDNVYEVTEYWNAPEITVSGEVTYDIPNSNFPGYSQARGFKVELWDAENNGPGELLDIKYTDEWGTFTFDTKFNFESNNSLRDICVKVFAVNDVAAVGDSLEVVPIFNCDQLDVVPYIYYTDTVWDVPSGEYKWSPLQNPPIALDTSVSGFFFVADVIKQGYDYWKSKRPGYLSNKTDVYLRNQNQLKTSYIECHDFISIEKSYISDNTRFPDTFDKDVILHEYAHRLHYTHDFFDDTTNDTDSHSLTTILSSTFAVKEGFANFYPSIVKNNKYIYDTFNNFKDTAWFDLETGLYGQEGFSGIITRGTANHLGGSNEGSVAGILWDIYDTPNDDYSGQVDWGDTLLNVNPDNIGDSLTIPIDTILSVLLDRTIDGHHPDNITEFWQAWFQAPSFGHDQAMSDIWYEHGILQTCCVGMRGDVNGDSIISVADLNAFVAYMFQGGTISCLEEANVNCSDDTGEDFGISVTDVLYLNAYMFQGGSAPCNCP